MNVSRSTEAQDTEALVSLSAKLGKTSIFETLRHQHSCSSRGMQFACDQCVPARRAHLPGLLVADLSAAGRGAILDLPHALLRRFAVPSRQHTSDSEEEVVSLPAADAPATVWAVQEKPTKLHEYDLVDARLMLRLGASSSDRRRCRRGYRAKVEEDPELG
eukprot:s810_g10.t1